MEKKNYVSLNGCWYMDFLGGKEYNSTEAPSLQKVELIEGCVPGYWEDMIDKFRMTKIHTRLEYNPLYANLRYPMEGYAPDTCLDNILGCFVYSRKFNLGDPANLPALLYVGGAHNTFDAWINGTYIGKHRGYSSEFTLDIPEGVLVSGENDIIIVLSNTRQEGYEGRPVSGCTARAANECTGGIYGDVEIRFIPDGLVSTYIRCDNDLSGFTVNLVGEVSTDYTVEILDDETVIAKKSVGAGENAVYFERGDMSLWSTKNAKLYTAKVTTKNQVYEQKFGIRKFLRDGMNLTLNGEAFYFRAICEHGYYPITIHPPRDISYYREVVKRLKELGFNAIRFHTWVPMAEYMQAADEAGIVIEVETPNNTTLAEWQEIVNYTRKYTSVVMYSSGNEMVIDEDYIEHLRCAAEMVHGGTDSLFSPMSAMRGIEYVLSGNIVDEPFPHNPERLAVISEFCDAYNSYSRGTTSYKSDLGDPEYLARCNSIYTRPILSHEICINGTYIDFSVEPRYEKSRIGKTEIFSSVREHLSDKGLLERAPVYFRNSALWQQLSRKYCFEVCRRTENFAGYDYLGDIDHHWHTFGYCVGMMNEFYELKPGETVENVRRYNDDAVLLIDLPRCRNFRAGEKVSFPIHISNYGPHIDKATLTLRVASESSVYFFREVKLSNIRSGGQTKLADLSFVMPKVEKPEELIITAAISGANILQNNRWEIYVYPRVKATKPTKAAMKEANVVIADRMTADELRRAIKSKKRILLLSAEPFSSVQNSFQISIAGRTAGHLATVIRDSDILRDLPHGGWCSWQFREMMNNSTAAVLDLPMADFNPIIEVAASYKNARREAMLFEYEIEGAKLLVSTLNLNPLDAGAEWIKAKLYDYVMNGRFEPSDKLSAWELEALLSIGKVAVSENTNNAQNQNDITMRVVKK